MNWLSQLHALEPLWQPRLVVFLLVLARVSGLVLTAPILGAREAPMRVRAFLAVTIAFIVTPVTWHTVVHTPGTLVHGAALVLGELLIGVTLGLGVMIIFTGIQVAGQLIGQVSGMALGEVFNPGFNEDIHSISQLLFYVTMAVFVLVGGHRQVMEALLQTFAALPPGTGAAPLATLETLTTLLSESFVLGIRASAPVLTALMLATVVLGLIARTLPQLNALALGVPLNTIVALSALAISLGTIVEVFESQLGDMLTTISATWSG